MPGAYVENYGVPADDGAVFLGRRASPMFLGLALMLWMARDATAGTARTGVCVGVACMWIGIGMTGLFEFARGAASISIVVAAVGEFFLAGLLLLAVRSQRRP